MRFASAQVASRYPLPVAGTLDWQRIGSRHRACLPLPPVAADQIIVPSFSMLGAADYGFQFALEAGGHRWALAAINSEPLLEETRDGALATHVDYFQTARAIDDAQLLLEVTSASAPTDYLLTVGVRAPRIDPAAGTRTSRRLPVPPLTQLTAPRTIRRHICSPTCVTMVLRHYGVDTHLGDVARRCYHHPTRMFGVWPAALHTASRHGVIGAVEPFADTDTAAELADASIPLITSIRFAAGALTGAPQNSTGGHLVVATGWDTERVFVNDPCARDPRDVCTSYLRDEFARAWLTHRGAGYVLLPP
jgi:hypothetical protein